MKRVGGLAPLLMAAGLGCGGTTVAEVEEKVFTPSCVFMACHGGQGAAGLNLEAPVYDKLVGTASSQRPEKQRVVPSDPDASYLMDKLLGRELPTGITSVRMPPGQPLDDERLELVRGWIADGAPKE